jgi:hypothetical protein
MPTLKDVFRTAVAALLFLLLASLLTYNRSDAAGAMKSTAPARGYYLTTGTFECNFVPLWTVVDSGRLMSHLEWRAFMPFRFQMAILMRSLPMPCSNIFGNLSEAF